MPPSREIPLRNRKGEVVAVALVDEADYGLVSQHRWHVHKVKNSRASYARSTKQRGACHLMMHRLIIPGADTVDHINGDGLDNRRCNLRAASRKQNSHNAQRRCDNTSGYKGVHWDKEQRKWRATIRAHGQIHRLGRFPTPEEAHAAYVKAAEELHGEFANAG